MSAVKITSSHAGHGGTDPGAVWGKYGEHIIASQINKKWLSITGGVDCSVENSTSINDNLAKISAKVNAVSKSGSNINISHHLNASGGVGTGTEVWYWEGDAVSKAYAAAISKAIANALGIPDRGAKATNNFYVHRNTTGRMLLIEWCFIDRKGDVESLLKNMDKAVVAATAALGYNAKAPAPTKEPTPVKKPEANSTPAKDFSKQYFTVNPKKVRLKTAQGLRKLTDVEFTGNSTYGGSYKAGTVFAITGLKYTKAGCPRLITQSGHLLTANKADVEEITVSPAKKTGSYKIKSAIGANIRSAASKNAPIVGSYPQGATFNYDQTVVADGYTWYSYIGSQSKKRVYVAAV